MKYLSSLLLGLAMITLAGCTTVKQNLTNQNLMVYVGTYAKPDAESIFGYSLNEQTGQLTKAWAIKGETNPSFLALSADRRHMYAVNETGDYQGQKSGAVSAFRLDPATGQPSLLNRQPSLGSAPCYISLDSANQMALVANYGGGNVTSYLIDNGQLADPLGSQQHQGAGSKKANAHCILPDPAHKFVLAVDLGIDQVLAYEPLPEMGELRRNQKVAYQTQPGAGPRHLTFHPNGKYAYLINELNSTLVALTYNPNEGTFTEDYTISTLPAGFTGESFCADVHVSKDGQYVYGSNRGHNSIVVFKIDQNTNRLTLVQHISTEGDWPRNFALSPSGKTLLVANQRSSNITSYTVDPSTGKLTYTGTSLTLPVPPVFLKIVTGFPAIPKS